MTGFSNIVFVSSRFSSARTPASLKGRVPPRKQDVMLKNRRPPCTFADPVRGAVKEGSWLTQHLVFAVDRPLPVNKQLGFPALNLARHTNEPAVGRYHKSMQLLNKPVVLFGSHFCADGADVAGPPRGGDKAKESSTERHGGGGGTTRPCDLERRGGGGGTTRPRQQGSRGASSEAARRQGATCARGRFA